jgi:hypothetical protein
MLPLPSVEAWTVELNAEFEALAFRLRPLLVQHPRADAWRLARLLEPTADFSRPLPHFVPRLVSDVALVAGRPI